MSFITTKCGGYIGLKPLPQKTEEEILIQVDPLPPTGLTFRDEIVNNEETSIEPLPPTGITFKNSNR